ncbi:MAG: calcium/sodium antiporter [Synergistaceae bacterium]|nr:calcium/sodium antiporter [Synergistaceae bacterium]
MGILFAALIFTFGVILVIKGGDVFVDAASWIAHAAGIPTFIIGATIVSLATTMPEMIVSCLAAAQGKIDMAIGNAIGSVTANTGLIMALAFIFMKVVITRKDYLLQCIILIVCAALLPLGSLSGHLSVWSCVMLSVLFAAFMLLNLRQAKEQSSAVRHSEERMVQNQIVKNVTLFVVGIIMIVGGSQLLINGGTRLAKVFGVPERIIAVTFVAIGTSLPELVTTLTAIRKKESALSVGNIVGANVIDLSLILPVCSIISGRKLPVSDMMLRIDFPACVAVLLLALMPLLLREKANRIHGIAVLSVYIAYLAVTL